MNNMRSKLNSILANSGKTLSKAPVTVGLYPQKKWIVEEVDRNGIKTVTYYTSLEEIRLELIGVNKGPSIDQETLCGMIDAGKSLSEITFLTGMKNTSYLEGYLDGVGIQIPFKRRGVTASKVDQVVRLHTIEWRTQDEIAGMVCICRPTVRRILAESQIEALPHALRREVQAHRKRRPGASLAVLKQDMVTRFNVGAKGAPLWAGWVNWTSDEIG